MPKNEEFEENLWISVAPNILASQPTPLTYPPRNKALLRAY